MSTLTATPPAARYARAAGEEPLPGYRLLEPLGRGGFGEVWKCEAPGGLHKAVKVVAPDPDHGGTDALAQELRAFQAIKAIRHPFILQLERVELVAGQLVMVMELADTQLHDRFAECTAAGLPGIPRDELLRYFLEIAEALDVIAAQHNLQHLDVKPANLFLIGGHAKVGDYGLVARLESAPGMVDRGFTPRYVAPEVLQGEVHPRSDQYSLALVYQELLTGVFPYSGRSASQLMLQHMSGTPDLTPLPAADRPAVARAMGKDPAGRFPTCLEFVRAIGAAAPAPPVTSESEAVRATWTDRGAAARTQVALPTPTVRLRPPSVATSLAGLPPLTVAQAAAPTLSVSPPPSSPKPAPARTREVRLAPIFSVVSEDRLLGRPDEPCGYVATEYITALLEAAAGWAVPDDPGQVVRLPDGAWGARFPTTLTPGVAVLKLRRLLDDGWCDEVARAAPDRVVLRVRGGTPERPAAVEVTVRLPAPAAPPVPATSRGSGLVAVAPPDASGALGEVVVIAELVGTPDSAFVSRAAAGVPDLIREIRVALGTAVERRKFRRVAHDGPVTVYPFTRDGYVLAPVSGTCRDVSAGGFACVLDEPVEAKYLFAAFDGVPRIDGLAILAYVRRTRSSGNEHFLSARFRVDL